MENLLAQFLHELENSFQQAQLVKITLSKPLDKNSPIRNIYGKRVLIKQKFCISWTFRYETKDETKNVDLATALQQLSEWLGKDFGIATLASTERDTRWELNAKKLFHQKASQAQAPAAQHNSSKNYHIAENSPFLSTLGISSSAGKVHAAQQHKFRQINKYVEIMDKLLQNYTQPIRILDMGSGKGYLTFALYQHFKIQQQRDIQIQGIELRPHLAEFCNLSARALGWQDGLSFVSEDIKNIDASQTNVLIALHACDTATDLAIAKGIQAQADYVVVAPCCHKQVRRDMQQSQVLPNVLKFGILQERQAELITDGIRALLLENAGYQTKVFEFIDQEHSSKNLMITAHKIHPSSDKHSAEIAQIKQQFGFKTHFLETLLE